MTKYEIAVRLLAEYCDCPSKDGTTVDLPMEWCENHCKYEGDDIGHEETLQCWEKVINDRYEAQGEEDKKEPCEERNGMTRAEAIKWIRFDIAMIKFDPSTGGDAYLSDDAKKVIKAQEMAIKALKQPEPCGDAVSREAVLEHYRVTDPAGTFAYCDSILDFVESLPPVTPKMPECEDAVSRSGAIIQLSHNKIGDDDCDVVIQRDIETIKRLQPVTPKTAECEQPEIIRCKNCRHWTRTHGDDRWGIGDCDAFDKHLVMCEGYCAWAERRTNANTDA